MKFRNIIFSVFIVVSIFFTTIGFCQELPVFTLIPNSQVGLSDYPNLEIWGQAITDLDYNGWLDVFLVRWKNHRDEFSFAFLNDNGKFEDFTDHTSMKSIENHIQFVRTLSVVDYDNDGDRDIFFCSEDSMYLLQNNNMTFTETAKSVGLISHKPTGLITRWDYNIGAWADFDLDGDLDLIVEQSNYPHLYLYRNDNGKFTDVAAQYGLVNVNKVLTNWEGGTSYSRLHWVDFDQDGDPDLSTGPKLYRNDGNFFTEVSASLGFLPCLPIQNSEWYDFDNDGDLDFVKTCNYPEDSGCSMQLWQNRDGKFVNITSEVINPWGILNLSRGMSVGDFDNDGDQDLWLAYNQTGILDAVLLNDEAEPGVRVMEDVARHLGLHSVTYAPTLYADTKGGTFLDYDKDGFLDIYLPATNVNQQLWHNGGNDNNWVGFILEGTVSNKEAIGAMVKVYSGGQQQLRYRKCPDGWNRQHMPWLHFGLGQAATIDSVVIRWPMGLKEVLTDVAINQYHEIKEGGTTSVSRRDDRMPVEYTLEQNYPNPFNPQTTIRYSSPKAGQVQLYIYNVDGKFVRRFEHSSSTAGLNQILWDGRDEDGRPMPSGMYFYTLKTEGYIETQKMLLVK
jgi:hypothetical protein